LGVENEDLLGLSSFFKKGGQILLAPLVRKTGPERERGPVKKKTRTKEFSAGQKIGGKIVREEEFLISSLGGSLAGKKETSPV